MDWASAEWKQTLTPLASQKVNALEETISNLKKERQQKQLQYECLELALEKEKRKTEKEKQQAAEVQRELQTLADVCKDFENKQQKFQNEIQSRDQRIKNLEALLSQSKKESFKLQQLESDLKDLTLMRENVLQAREQTLQSSNKGNNPDISKDNFENEKALKQKIAEQEALIIELKSNISLSKNVELNESSSGPFKTPKSKALSVTDSPAVSSKASSNVWDAFVSTPAKGNKDRILGHNDSSSIDSGDEKLVALQSRLKQMCQELDCQRHNFEASKNSLETKYKESEATLKADLKYQIQANSVLDKELKDSKNRYQQELTQATKKLDILALQLKKTEEAKLQIERDLKSLESKLSANESSSRLKEEQLQDLQKSKNACEASLQSLQFKFNEFEEKCKVLVEEKNVAIEHVKACQIQLEGSNNLVKEKEIGLLEAQKKLANVQVKMNEQENQFIAQQEKLKISQDKETLLTEQLEFLEQEKQELHTSLNSEIAKCKSMESSIADQKQELFLLKKELDEKTCMVDELKNQIMISSNKYEVAMHESEVKLHSVSEELLVLQAQLHESSSIEVSLREQVEQLKISNKELFDKLTTELNKSDCLKQNLEEEAQKMTMFKEELSLKCLKLEEVNSQLETSENQLKNEIKELNSTLQLSKDKITSLDAELIATSSNENSIKGKKELLEKEKLELSNQLNMECLKVQELELEIKAKQESICELNQQILVSRQELNTLENRVTENDSLAEQLEISNKDLLDKLNAEIQKSDYLKLNLEEEAQTMSSIRDELSSKYLELDERNNQLQLSKNQLENEIHELMETLKTSKDKISSLEAELLAFTSESNIIKEKLGLVEKDKSELTTQLNLENAKVEQLESTIEEQKQDCFVLKEKLEKKCIEFEDYNHQMNVLNSEHKKNIYELEEKLTLTRQELDTLQIQLQDGSSLEVSLRQKVDQLEMSNQELSNELNAETHRNICLKQNLEEEANKMASLREELSSTCSKLDELNIQMQDSKDLFEKNIYELEEKLTLTRQELDTLQIQLQDGSLLKVSLRQKVDQLEMSNQKLSDELNAETHRHICLKQNLEEDAEIKIASLREELSSTLSKKLDELNIQIQNSKDQFENDIQELKVISDEKIKSLETNVTDLISNENLLKDKLNLAEKDRNQYETKIQELDASLGSSEDKVLCLEAQIKDISSNEINIKVKLEEAEQEKSVLSNQLQVETQRVKELELAIEDEKQASVLLKERLEGYFAEFEVLSSQIDNLNKLYQEKVTEWETMYCSVEEKVIMLENERKECSSISSKEEIEKAKKQNKELLDQITSQTMKIQELESCIETEKHETSLLKVKLENFNEEFTELNSQIKNLNDLHEEKVTELETKFSTIESKSIMLETELSRFPTKEEIGLLEHEKSELCNLLELEVIKVQQLELSMKEGKEVCCQLQEKLDHKCLELEDLNRQVNVLKNEHEVKMLDLEGKLSNSETRSAAIELKLKECSLTESLLNEKVKQLETENIHLSDLLHKKSEEAMTLTTNIEALKKVQSSLEEKCALYSEQLENREKIIEYENKIMDIESQLLTVQTERTNFQNQLQDIVSKEESLKSNLTLLEKKNKEMNDKLNAEITKTEELELIVQKLKISCASCEEELSKKSLQLAESDKEKISFENVFQNKIEDFQSRLIVAEKQKEDFQNQLQEITANEALLRDRLTISEKGNIEVTSQLDAEISKTEELELLLQELRKSCASFEEDLAKKTLQLEEVDKKRNNLQNETQVTMLDLERKLLNSETHSAAVELKLKEIAITESSLNEKVKQLEKENIDLLDLLQQKTEEAMTLTTDIEALKKVLSSMEEKCGLDSEQLENKEKIIDYENKMQDFENRLLTVQAERTNFQNQLQEVVSKEELLKSNSTLLEKENKEMNDKLNEEIKKTEELELIVQELKKSCASFEEELAKKTLQLEEADRQSVKINNELQNEIKDSKSRLLDAQKQQTDFQNQLQEMDFKEETLKNRLALSEEENTTITDKLIAEITKLQELELLLKELQRSHAYFEEELSKKSLQFEEANKQRIILENELQALSNTRNYIEHMPKIQESGLDSPKQEKLLLIQTEDSSPLPSLKFDSNESGLWHNDIKSDHLLQNHHSFEKVCTVEEDLIANLETIKFLCSYKLIEKKDVSHTWKKFLSLRKQLQQIQFLKRLIYCVQNILKSTVAASKLKKDNMQLTTLLPEKLHLAAQDLFDMCGNTLKEVLEVVLQTLQQNKTVTELISLVSPKIHLNHLPVITSTKIVLYHHHMNNTYFNSFVGHKELQRANCLQVTTLPQEMKKVVDILNIEELPCFMNYAVALTECILEPTCIAQYLQMWFELPATLSPLLRLLKQYLVDCLNPDNARSLDEINYWKAHCDILGVSKSDFEKIIPLFECKNNKISKVNKGLELEIKNTEKECGAIEASKFALDNLLLDKEKQIALLNSTIEAIENDLGETYQKKENFKKMLLKTCEVLTQLKANVGTANTFLSVNFESELSGEFCFCESCIVEEGENELHEKLALPSLFKCVTELLQISCQLETEILNFRQSETDLSMKYKKLQDRNSELEMALSDSGVSSKDTQDEINSLKYELSKAKESYEYIYQTADQKDILILELESTNSNLSNTFKQCNAKLEVCEDQILKLSTELDGLRVVVLSKDERIEILRKTIEDEELKCQNNQIKCKEYEDKIKLLSNNIENVLSSLQEKETLIKTLEIEASLYESTQLKCKEYESELQLLSSTISKLREENKQNERNSALKAVRNVANELENGKSLMDTISELECKVESLKKSNDDLNSTIETIKEELNTVYLEKQDIEESEKVTNELNILLQEEISHADQKYSSEKEELILKLKESEKHIANSNSMINQLKIEKDLLEKDIRTLKVVMREHEISNMDKSYTIKTQKSTIDQLNNKVSKIEQENANLKPKTEESIEEALNAQVENLNSQCSIFEKEIKRLQLVEKEKAMLEKNISEIEIHRNELIKDLEKMNKDLRQYEKKQQELKSKNQEADDTLNKEVILRLSMEEKLESSNKLNSQLQELTISNEHLKLINSEQSTENCKLKERVDSLEREIKQLAGMFKKTNEESKQLAADNEELNVELRECRNSIAALESESDSFKNALSNTIQFIKNILDISISTIGSYSDYPDVEGLKSSLVLLAHWKQGSQTLAKGEDIFTDEVLHNLRSFYIAQANNHQELLAMRDYIRSIIDFVNDLALNCKSNEQNPQACNFADATNMSIFETTFTGSFPVLTKSSCSSTTLKVELKETRKLLEECFNGLKHINTKQSEEIENLKKELPPKMVASNSEASEMNTLYKQKFKIISVQYQRLGKEYSKQEATVSELRECVKTLEKDKKNLEEENIELAEDVNKLMAQYSGSDELAETLTELTRIKQKLTQAENDKNLLKQKLQAYQSKEEKKVLFGSEAASNVLGAVNSKENLRRNDI